MLLYCADQETEFNRANQLETCCGMTGDCTMSMENADACLSSELVNVKSTAVDYLKCVYLKRENGACVFAIFCVSILTGGSGTGAMNDFSVAGGSSLAELTNNAQTCSDMDIFGGNVCRSVQGCCDPCANKIAAVANAVTNDILLPTYGNGAISQCADKTCDQFIGATRHLETTDKSSTDATTTDSGTTAEVVALAHECTQSLSIDIVSYNHTYAAENFLPCLYKKVGKVLAETNVTTESSSAVAFFSGSAFVAITMTASTVFASLA